MEKKNIVITEENQRAEERELIDVTNNNPTRVCDGAPLVCPLSTYACRTDCAACVTRPHINNADTKVGEKLICLWNQVCLGVIKATLKTKRAGKKK